MESRQISPPTGERAVRVALELALEYLERYAAAAPADPAAFTGMGDLHRRMGAFPEARQSYNRALALDPGNTRYAVALERAKLKAAADHFTKGRRYQEAGQFELAAAGKSEQLSGGVVTDLRKHPLPAMIAAGLNVTVNTDDPKMFGNSLAKEYALLESELGFTRTDVQTVILNGVHASWLPEGKQVKLEQAFRSDPAWAEQP